jgi:hypothetical protein
LPRFRPFSAIDRRIVAGDHCKIFLTSRVIRPALLRIWTMIRAPGAAGFESNHAPVASSRLLGAIATSLAIGTLSLCLMVTLTVLSIKATVAMPIP